TIRLSFVGSAGQSFGAFCVEGMSLHLDGEANDGVGKGMSGGEIVLRAPRGRARRGSVDVLAGNAVLYGATGGRAFIAGRVGEREQAWLAQVVARHAELTGSERARGIVAAWAEWLPRFRRVAPRAGATRVLPAFKLEWETTVPRIAAARPRRIAARGGYARA